MYARQEGTDQLHITIIALKKYRHNYIFKLKNNFILNFSSSLSLSKIWTRGSCILCIGGRFPRLRVP